MQKSAFYRTKPCVGVRRGFSLVELSIVLVILGLLAGGVLSGQALIRAAEMRSIASDMERYRTAFSSFRDKYFALPGDMTNATAFWGIAGGTTGNDATCFNTSSTDAKTCNGDGDGMLRYGYGDGTNYYEQFRAWQQLANAGLIEGSYTGMTASAYVALIGVNVPKSKVGNAGYQIYSNGSGTYADGNWFPATYGNIVVVGSGTGGFLSGPVFEPAEAWNIDTKVDDGKPATGWMMVFRANLNPGCTTNDNPTLADYVYTSTTKVCSLIFKTGY